MRLQTLPPSPPPKRIAGALLRRDAEAAASSTTRAELIALGMSRSRRGDRPRSCVVAVPILGSDRLLGIIVLENYEREQRLRRVGGAAAVAPLPASMGVALENARLFDETQRLLKETEQRAAELAIINSVQEGLAAKLDFQAIIDLVGDKIREIFRSPDMSIRCSTGAATVDAMPYY